MSTQTQDTPASLAARPVILIKQSMGSHDCETCGWYETGDVAITLADGRTIEAHYDGHMGGGAWDGTLETLHLWCLQALGITVLLDGEVISRQPYRVQQSVAPYEWDEVSLAPQSGQPLCVQMHWAKGTHVKWTSAAGVARSLRHDLDANSTEESQGVWTGYPAELLEVILNEHAQVLMTEESPSDEDLDVEG